LAFTEKKLKYKFVRPLKMIQKFTTN